MRLIHFESIGRLKSLKRASVELGISQPAVTQSLKKIESSLDTRLCIRTRSSFALTESGKRLHELSVEIKKGLKNFESFLDNENEFDGLFSIGILDNIQNRKFEVLLKKIVNNFPKVRLNVQSYTAVEIQDLIAIGELDIGFGVFNHKRDNLSYIEIGSEKICHYISNRHFLWNKRTITKKDIINTQITWADMVSRNRTAIEVEIFSRNRLGSATYYGSYANNLNAAVFILQTGVSIVSLPEGHIESKRLSFKYRKLDVVFKPFLLKQEIVFRQDFSNHSIVTNSFLNLINDLKK